MSSGVILPMTQKQISRIALETRSSIVHMSYLSLNSDIKLKIILLITRSSIVEANIIPMKFILLYELMLLVNFSFWSVTVARFWY